MSLPPNIGLPRASAAIVIIQRPLMQAIVIETTANTSPSLNPTVLEPALVHGPSLIRTDTLPNTILSPSLIRTDTLPNTILSSSSSSAFSSSLSPNVTLPDEFPAPANLSLAFQTPNAQPISPPPCFKTFSEIHKTIYLLFKQHPEYGYILESNLEPTRVNVEFTKDLLSFFEEQFNLRKDLEGLKIKYGQLKEILGLNILVKLIGIFPVSGWIRSFSALLTYSNYIQEVYEIFPANFQLNNLKMKITTFLSRRIHVDDSKLILIFHELSLKVKELITNEKAYYDTKKIIIEFLDNFPKCKNTLRCVQNCETAIDKLSQLKESPNPQRKRKLEQASNANAKRRKVDDAHQNDDETTAARLLVELRIDNGPAENTETTAAQLLIGLRDQNNKKDAPMRNHTSQSNGDEDEKEN